MHTFGVPYLWLSDKAGQHVLLPISKHVQLWIGWGQLQLNKGKSGRCVLDHHLQQSDENRDLQIKQRNVLQVLPF